jgi:hypothetical protein
MKEKAAKKIEVVKVHFVWNFFNTRTCYFYYNFFLIIQLLWVHKFQEKTFLEN